MIRGRYTFIAEDALASSQIPETDNAFDLGSATKEWKDLYIDGTAYIDKLDCALILPTTGPVVIGDAGTTNHSLTANDDLFVTGKLEVDGQAWFDGATSIRCQGISEFVGTNNIYGGLAVRKPSTGAAYLLLDMVHEEVTIPVGSGLDPVVVSTTNLAPASSIIDMVAVRVTQAPGGGATTLDVGRTGGNTDEFIDGIATSLGTTGNCVDDGDGTNTGPVFNSTAGTFTLTTDADVTGTAMKVRIVVWYRQVTEPTS